MKRDEANAREREEAILEAMPRWLGAIAEGQTQRAAAIPIERQYHHLGITYAVLLGRAERDPDWSSALEAAKATKVERMESVLRRIATSEPGDISEDPGSAKVKASTAQWLLSKWDRDTYGDAKKVDNTVTVKPAPTDDSPERVAEDALGLLTEEQRAAIVAKWSKGDGA